MASPQTVINLVCFPFFEQKEREAVPLFFVRVHPLCLNKTAREANIGQILAHKGV